MKTNNKFPILYNLLFIIIVFYQSFHYIFMYSSSGTSPTYTNTPLLWQTSKYILLTLILFFIYMQSQFISKVKISVWIY